MARPHEGRLDKHAQTWGVHAPVCACVHMYTHTCIRTHTAQATSCTLAPGLSQLQAVRNSTFWDVYERDSSSPLNPFKKINTPPPQRGQLNPALALVSSDPRAPWYGPAPPSPLLPVPARSLNPNPTDTERALGGSFSQLTCPGAQPENTAGTTVLNKQS